MGNEMSTTEKGGRQEDGATLQIEQSNKKPKKKKSKVNGNGHGSNSSHAIKKSNTMCQTATANAADGKKVSKAKRRRQKIAKRNRESKESGGDPAHHTLPSHTLREMRAPSGGHQLVEIAPAAPKRDSNNSARNYLAQLARDREGLRQAKRLARAGARRSGDLPEHPQIAIIEQKLFYVDVYGDPALEACDSLHPFSVLPTNEEILGSSFYIEDRAVRQLVLGFDLCGEQEALVKLVMEGHNVCFTGPAGSGKSYVVRAFCEQLVREGKRVFKVGPTGVSALNIGGQTTYGYAGWMPSSEKIPIGSLERDARIGELWERHNETDVLVVDEVSMVNSHHTSRLNQVCRAARQPQPPTHADGSRDYDAKVEWCESDRYGQEDDRSPHDSTLPFGGIQIIVTGDFCQLPPVLPFKTCFPCGRTTEAEHCDEGPWICRVCSLTFNIDDCWAFQSPAWEECRFKYVQLVEVHRQKDPKFAEILHTFRNAPGLTEKQIQTVHTMTKHEVKEAVHLFARNEDADRMNAAMLYRIQEPTRIYASVDEFKWNELDPSHRKFGVRGTGLRINYLKNHRFSAPLDTKIGMPVMLLIGGSPGSRLVNGSQGTVVGYDTYDPARPSKSLPTVPSPVSSERVDHAEFRTEMLGRWFANTNVLPIVEFSDGQRLLIHPSCEIEEIGDDKPYSLVSRTQLPIRPAWALTIHKSQGLTLPRMVLHVDHIRSREMMYVGLSRATSFEGLQIVTRNDLSMLGPGGRLVTWNAAVKAFREQRFGKETLLLSED